MPNINIDDAYILEETGAQVDKVTGLFTKDENTTSGEKAFAQLNIGASGGGGGGRNLLDNPFFRVNQRYFSSSTANGLTVDRWRQHNCNTAVLGAGGLRIRSTNGGTFYENCPYDALLIGSTVTISVMYADGTVDSGAVVIPSSGTAYTGSFSNGARLGITVTGTSMIGFQFELPANADISVYAFKWELGSVSTLANDAPPNYAEELAKCNFYDTMLKTSAQYGYCGYGIADSATSATILIPLPNNMRDATPTITTSGTIAVKGGTSGTHTITGITFKLRVTGGVLVTVETAGLTTGEFCLLQLNNTSSYINISADL